jgi:hypothetical protein
VEVNLTVDRSDRVSGSLAVGVSSALSDGTNLPPEAQLSESFSNIGEVLVERFNEDGFVGERAVFTDAPLSVFAPVEGSNQLVSFERIEDTLHIGGVLDLSGLEGAESAGASLDNISIRITVPGTIIATNGQIDDSSNSIIWSPVFGERLELFATVDAPLGGTLSIAVAVALAAGIMLVGGALYLVRRTHKLQGNPSTASTD